MSVKEEVLIRQAELQQIYLLEQDIAEKQHRLDDLKQGVKVLLIHKTPVEDGRFSVHLVKIPGRNVPWKQVVVEELGIDFAEMCRKRYPVSVRFEVKVEEHAVPPLWRNGANSLEAS